MDRIVCNVMSKYDERLAEIGTPICAKIADQLEALLLTADRMQDELAENRDPDILFHRIDMTIVSDHLIAYRYAVGTAAEWRTGRQKTLDDLYLDVMDRKLDSLVSTMMVDTMRRLSR